MTHVPASSHTVFNGGTITGVLEIDPASGGQSALVIHADPADTVNTESRFDQHGNLSILSGGSFQEAFISLADNTSGNPGSILIDTFHGVVLTPEGTASPIVTVAPQAAHTGRLLQAKATDGITETLAISIGGYLLVKTHAAPADAALVAGECALWFDQTNGAGALKVKAKTANGTVASATIPLT